MNNGIVCSSFTRINMHNKLPALHQNWVNVLKNKKGAMNGFKKTDKLDESEVVAKL